MLKYSLFRFHFLVALETDYERYAELELLSGFDDTLRDIVATHDTFSNFRSHSTPNI